MPSAKESFPPKTTGFFGVSFSGFTGSYKGLIVGLATSYKGLIATLRVSSKDFGLLIGLFKVSITGICSYKDSKIFSAVELYLLNSSNSSIDYNYLMLNLGVSSSSFYSFS